MNLWENAGRSNLTDGNRMTETCNSLFLKNEENKIVPSGRNLRTVVHSCCPLQLLLSQDYSHCLIFTKRTKEYNPLCGILFNRMY